MRPKREIVDTPQIECDEVHPGPFPCFCPSGGSQQAAEQGCVDAQRTLNAPLQRGPGRGPVHRLNTVHTVNCRDVNEVP